VVVWWMRVWARDWGGKGEGALSTTAVSAREWRAVEPGEGREVSSFESSDSVSGS